MATTVTMAGLVSEITTGLRAALTCPVEEYWRLEPPEVLTCYVQPKQEPAERGVGMGQLWASGFQVSVLLEAPWDDKVATGASLSAAVEDVKTWVAAHRALITDGDVDYVTKCGTIDYGFVTRPGAGKPVFSAQVPLLIEWPI